MTRLPFLLSSVLICSLLNSCGGSTPTKPTVIWNAEQYSNEGVKAYADADWDRAQQLFNRALSLYQAIDHQSGILNNHINLVEVALSKRDYQTAIHHLGRAENHAKNDSLQTYQARISLLYVLLALQQNQMAEAESLLQGLLPVFEGNSVVVIPDTIQLAALASRTKIAFLKKHNESLWTLRYANALKVSTNKNIEMEARLLRFQSALLLNQGDYGAAKNNLQQALSIYKKTLYRPGIAMTLLELGLLFEKQSQWHSAQEYLNRSAHVFRSLRDDKKINQINEMLVKVQKELGILDNSQNHEE